MAEFVPDEKARRTPRCGRVTSRLRRSARSFWHAAAKHPKKKRRAFASHARRAKEWLLDRESLLSFGIHAGLQTGRGDSACGVGAVSGRSGRGGDRRRRALPAWPRCSTERETSRGQGHRRRRPGRAVLLEERAAARASGSAVAAVGADPLGEQPPVRVELLDPVVGAIGHVHVAGAVNGDPGSDHGRTEVLLGGGAAVRSRLQCNLPTDGRSRARRKFAKEAALAAAREADSEYCPIVLARGPPGCPKNARARDDARWARRRSLAGPVVLHALARQGQRRRFRHSWYGQRLESRLVPLVAQPAAGRRVVLVRRAGGRRRGQHLLVAL